MREIKFGYLSEKKVAKIGKRKLDPIKGSEVLIKQEACNICTTDYQQWQGLREHQGYPMAGGHECSGIVLEKGPDVSDAIEIGDRVSILFDHCGVCESCRLGEITSCSNKAQFGKNYSDEYYGLFGFSNYFVREEQNLVKVSNDITASEAGFIEPLSTVIRSMKNVKINSGFDTVVVIGAGTMGLLNASVARAMGARVIVTEMLEKKIKVAQEMGFEVIDASKVDAVEAIKERTNNKGADIIVVAVGATGANNQALQMVKDKDGKIVMFSAGYPAPKMDLDPNDIHYRRLVIIGTYGSRLEDFEDASKMLSEKRIDVKPLIETKIALDDIQKAYETAATLGNYRVSVILND